MRYKVQAPDLAVYHNLVEILSGRVPILVASEKRRFLSTDDLPEDVRRRLEAEGAQITRDFQYDAELPVRG